MYWMASWSPVGNIMPVIKGNVATFWLTLGPLLRYTRNWGKDCRVNKRTLPDPKDFKLHEFSNKCYYKWCEGLILCTGSIMPLIKDNFTTFWLTLGPLVRYTRNRGTDWWVNKRTIPDRKDFNYWNTTTNRRINVWRPNFVGVEDSI